MNTGATPFSRRGGRRSTPSGAAEPRRPLATANIACGQAPRPAIDFAAADRDANFVFVTAQLRLQLEARLSGCIDAPFVHMGGRRDVGRRA